MHDKLQHLVEAGYNCVRDGVTQSPHIKELIKIAQNIQDEFNTKVMKRSTWAKHEDKDLDLDVAGGPTDLAAYLGTSYHIDLRKPKTKDELKAQLHQLEALSAYMLTTPNFLDRDQFRSSDEYLELHSFFFYKNTPNWLSLIILNFWPN